jgi:hypothetical protein
VAEGEELETNSLHHAAKGALGEREDLDRAFSKRGISEPSKKVAFLSYHLIRAD